MYLDILPSFYKNANNNTEKNRLYKDGQLNVKENECQETVIIIIIN